MEELQKREDLQNVLELFDMLEPAIESQMEDNDEDQSNSAFGASSSKLGKAIRVQSFNNSERDLEFWTKDPSRISEEKSKSISNSTSPDFPKRQPQPVSSASPIAFQKQVKRHSRMEEFYNIQENDQNKGTPQLNERRKSGGQFSQQFNMQRGANQDLAEEIDSKSFYDSHQGPKEHRNRTSFQNNVTIMMISDVSDPSVEAPNKFQKPLKSPAELYKEKGQLHEKFIEVPHGTTGPSFGKSDEPVSSPPKQGGSGINPMLNFLFERKPERKFSQQMKSRTQGNFSPETKDRLQIAHQGKSESDKNKDGSSRIRRYSQTVLDTPLGSLKGKSATIRDFSSMTEHEKEILGDIKERLINYMKQKEENDDWSRKKNPREKRGRLNLKKKLKEKNRDKKNAINKDDPNVDVKDLQAEIFQKLQNEIKKMMTMGAKRKKALDPGKVAYNIFKYQKACLGAGFGMEGPEIKEKKAEDMELQEKQMKRIAMIKRTLKKFNSKNLQKYNQLDLNNFVDRYFSEDSTPAQMGDGSSDLNQSSKNIFQGMFGKTTNHLNIRGYKEETKEQVEERRRQRAMVEVSAMLKTLSVNDNYQKMMRKYNDIVDKNNQKQEKLGSLLVQLEQLMQANRSEDAAEDRVTKRIQEREIVVSSPVNLFRSKMLDSMITSDNEVSSFDFTNHESIIERIYTLKSRLRVNKEQLLQEERQNQVYVRMLRQLRERQLSEVQQEKKMQEKRTELSQVVGQLDTINQMQKQRRFYLENLHEEYRQNILSDQEKMDRILDEKHASLKGLEVEGQKILFSLYQHLKEIKRVKKVIERIEEKNEIYQKQEQDLVQMFKHKSSELKTAWIIQKLIRIKKYHSTIEEVEARVDSDGKKLTIDEIRLEGLRSVERLKRQLSRVDSIPFFRPYLDVAMTSSIKSSSRFSKSRTSTRHILFKPSPLRKRMSYLNIGDSAKSQASTQKNQQSSTDEIHGQLESFFTNIEKHEDQHDMIFSDLDDFDSSNLIKILMQANIRLNSLRRAHNNLEEEKNAKLLLLSNSKKLLNFLENEADQINQFMYTLSMETSNSKSNMMLSEKLSFSNDVSVKETSSPRSAGMLLSMEGMHMYIEKLQIQNQQVYRKRSEYRKFIREFYTGFKDCLVTTVHKLQVMKEQGEDKIQFQIIDKSNMEHLIQKFGKIKAQSNQPSMMQFRMQRKETLVQKFEQSKSQLKLQFDGMQRKSSSGQKSSFANDQSVKKSKVVPYRPRLSFNNLTFTKGNDGKGVMRGRLITHSEEGNSLQSSEDSENSFHFSDEEKSEEEFSGEKSGKTKVKTTPHSHKASPRKLKMGVRRVKKKRVVYKSKDIMSWEQKDLVKDFHTLIKVLKNSQSNFKVSTKFLSRKTKNFDGNSSNLSILDFDPVFKKKEVLKVRKQIQNQMDLKKILTSKQKEILVKQARERLELNFLVDEEQIEFHKFGSQVRREQKQNQIAAEQKAHTLRLMQEQLSKADVDVTLDEDMVMQDSMEMDGSITKGKSKSQKPLFSSEKPRVSILQYRSPTLEERHENARLKKKLNKQKQQVQAIQRSEQFFLEKIRSRFKDKYASIRSTFLEKYDLENKKEEEEEVNEKPPRKPRVPVTTTNHRSKPLAGSLHQSVQLNPGTSLKLNKWGSLVSNRSIFSPETRNVSQVHQQPPNVRSRRDLSYFQKSRQAKTGHGQREHRLEPPSSSPYARDKPHRGPTNPVYSSFISPTSTGHSANEKMHSKHLLSSLGYLSGLPTDMKNSKGGQVPIKDLLSVKHQKTSLNHHHQQQRHPIFSQKEISINELSPSRTGRYTKVMSLDRDILSGRRREDSSSHSRGKPMFQMEERKPSLSRFTHMQTLQQQYDPNLLTAQTTKGKYGSGTSTVHRGSTSFEQKKSSFSRSRQINHTTIS